MNNVLNNIQGWVHNGYAGNHLMALDDGTTTVTASPSVAGGVGKVLGDAVIAFNKVNAETALSADFIISANSNDILPLLTRLADTNNVSFKFKVSRLPLFNVFSMFNRFFMDYCDDFNKVYHQPCYIYS